MRFKIGQEIVCINDEGWIDDYNRRVCGPSLNELCIVTGYETSHHAILKGYSLVEGYAEHCFEPVVDIKELQEILNQEFATL